MKIRFVTASISREAGGLFESVRRLAQTTANHAHDVVIFGLHDRHTDADRVAWRPLDVRVFRAVGPHRFSYAPALSAGLRSSKGNLVMSHGLWRYTSIATHRWHHQTGRPYIVHPHGMLDPWALRNSHLKKRIAATLYERKHLEDASCIRALCQAEAESIRACGLRNPICVIPNGIDLPEARSAQRGLPNAARQAFVPPGSRVLLYLGRIHPKKGLVNLLKAWKEVRGGKSKAGSLNPADWVLAIAGWDEGGHESELKRLATELGLKWEISRPRDYKTAGPQECGTHTRRQRTEDSRRCSVVFLGPRFGEAKEALYRDCDAFILPSFSEGLPMVVLEAWAFAKPVLMTLECNLPEGFAAGAALRIEKNVEGIVNGLHGLFRSSGAALQCTGSRGRDLVARRFSWDDIGETMRAVCAWVSGSGPKPDCVQTYS